LYSSRGTEETAQLAEGIKQLTSQARKFRFMEKGCVFFENGWDVTLDLHEESYEGIGLLLFALVLRNLLCNYLPINSCMKITVRSDQRGEIASWTL